MIGVLIIIVILAIYFVYDSYFSDSIISPQTEEVASQDMTDKYDINVEGLEEQNFVELEVHGRLDYTEQGSHLSYDPNVPTAPSDLSIKDPGYGNTIDIFWQGPVDGNYDYFKIYRSTDSNQQGDILVEKLSDMHYRDETVENNKDYFYSVYTTNTEGTESISYLKSKGKATDVIAPFKPFDVTISQESGNSIKIDWQNPVDKDFDYIKIYRSNKEGQLGSLIATEIRDAMYLDSNVIPGENYYYTLTSVDTSNNESSRVFTITTSGRDNPFKEF